MRRPCCLGLLFVCAVIAMIMGCAHVVGLLRHIAVPSAHEKVPQHHSFVVQLIASREQER